ncbi:MAG: hypothetical protein QHH09_00150 [Microgenomates group bacterium]|nr:hypothetical protein [Microgenomates group bacterium]
MNFREGFSNLGRFYMTTAGLSSHSVGGSFDEIDSKGNLVPPEKRKYLDILQEAMLYFFSVLVSPILFPIIFKDPKKAVFL